MHWVILSGVQCLPWALFGAQGAGFSSAIGPKVQGFSTCLKIYSTITPLKLQLNLLLQFKLKLLSHYDPSKVTKHNKQFPVKTIGNISLLRQLKLTLTSVSISEEKACTVHLPHKEL